MKRSVLVALGLLLVTLPVAAGQAPAEKVVLADPCATDAMTLCLQSDRFAVTVDWYDQYGDRSGQGQAVAYGDETGFFWFFNQENIELVVKVLDGTGVNGQYWVFYGALSDVEYTITVTDTTNDAVKTYTNEAGNICGDADTAAFEPKFFTAPLTGDGPFEPRPVGAPAGIPSKVSTTTCGNAFYDNGESENAFYFGGGFADDPDYMCAVKFELADFGFVAGATEIVGFCAGNDLGFQGGPWPNEVFIYPDDGGLPDDSVVLGHGTIETGDGTGQYEVTLDEPVLLQGDFWLVNRGDPMWTNEDFNMEYDAGPGTGNSYLNDGDGIAGLGQVTDVNFILRADLQEVTVDAPVAAFTYSPMEPLAGEMVQFTDASTGGTPTSWLWDFGDGGTSTQQNPTHAFAAAGDYDVTLTAANDGGADDATQTVTVTEPSAEDCVEDGETLCMLGGRFEVKVDWYDQYGDRSGTGMAIPQTDKTGLFWFFKEENIELLVKVLDGNPVNGHYWVFYGALSDIEYTITVRDTETGATKVYTNEAGDICGNADTEAF